MWTVLHINSHLGKSYVTMARPLTRPLLLPVHLVYKISPTEHTAAYPWKN